MNNQKGYKTTKKQIADYWSANSNICEAMLNFDWSDAYTHCWNCGDNKHIGNTNRLQRCHIIPNSLGGKDIPSNYVLLCIDCHREAPNIKNSYSMWKWILSNRLKYGLTGTYTIQKALDMFKKAKGFCFMSKAEYIPNIINLIGIESANISVHGTKTNASTYFALLERIHDDHFKANNLSEHD